MRWVLPTSIGHAEIFKDIPLEEVLEAIKHVRSEVEVFPIL